MKTDKDFEKFIDIEKIVNEGKSNVLKKLPKFVIRILKKVIYENELNRILNEYKNDVGIDFLPKMLKEFNITLDIQGLQNLPENSKCFFAGNHPFGIIDGLTLTYIVSQKYGNLKAIGNDAFMYVPQLRPLIAAVNVFGKSSREYLQALDETYEQNIPITHFPAGLVSRLIDNKIQDYEWQKSFITKSIASKRDIVPFYFKGRNSNLFYVVYIIRKLFRIKIAVELLLLPHEMFNKRNKTIHVIIGKPISYTVFNASKNHKSWAEKVRTHIYTLAKSNSEFNSN